MKINFFDLKKQYEEIGTEVENKTIEILRSGCYIGGPEVQALESELQEYLGVKHAITVANGTDALVLALVACGITTGDEVITTSFSFFATAEAIGRVGAIPVFVDIDEKTYNIDPTLIEEKITDKTKAILPVHIFGKCADMDAINDIAKKHSLIVIEDACQAIGSTYKGKKAGSLGDMACFSFYPTKNLGAFGDAGLITTNNDDFAKIITALKAHAGGKIGCEAREILFNEKNELSLSEEQTELYDPYKYYNYLIAYNSRLDSIQAGILRIKLKKLDEYNAKRQKIAQTYLEKLRTEKANLPLYSEEDCWHQFAFRVKNKEKLGSILNSKGVGNGNFYPVPLHLQKAFSDLNYQEGSLPKAEKLCKESICLPIFPELTEEEIEYIIENVNESLEEI